jgi:hypothetical protein
MADYNSSIFIETSKQNELFLSKINSFNKKQAKMIIAKYDWEHSPLDLIKKEQNLKELCSDIEKYLKERMIFLNFIAKYL